MRPITEDAAEWLHTHVQSDALWFGGALAVEPRYVRELLVGLEEHGFIVE